MSNNYNSQLLNNNANLDEILRKINLLPKVENVSVQTINFGEDGFAEVGKTPKTFEHKLSRDPIFVTIYANNVQEILNNSSTQYLIQTSKIIGNSSSYLFGGTTVQGGYMGADQERLIIKAEEGLVYVNAAATSRPWAPVGITTYTMVCVS